MNATLSMRSPHAHPRPQRWLALVLAAALLSGCAAERIRKEGVTLIQEGRYEEGLAKLNEAHAADPTNGDFRRDQLRQRELITNKLLIDAARERQQGHSEAAEKFYRRILGLDANNQQARAGLAEVETERRHAKLMDEAEAAFKKGDATTAKNLVHLVQVETPGHVKAGQLRYQIDQQTLKQTLVGPTLNISGRKPVTLQFKDATLKMVLEALSKTTGVNILFDKDVKSDAKVTVYIKDTPVEETLDLILLQNQLDKRVLGENTVLIYPNNPAKQKDYQELKVRRFQLTNADPKQVQNMLKTLFKSKDTFVDEKTGTLILRDSPQVIRLAEKLVAAMDVPDAEVMMEVEVIEINREKSLDLGLDWPTSAKFDIGSSTGPSLNELIHNRNTAGERMFRPDNIGVIWPGGTNLTVAAKFQKIDKDSNVLASPRIRARNKEKAKILIGERKPVISSAPNATTGGTGATTVYNTNIQYLEVGIKLEVEPTVYLDGEVAIKLNLEVSSPTDTYTDATTGTLAYTVSTNNITTILRLKDGETQIMGGLIRAEDAESAVNKIPGLGDVPILGRLFGIQKDTKNKKEIILAITPRIIRNARPSEADLIEMWSGTEANIKASMPNLMIPANAEVKGGVGTPPAAAPAPAVASPTARAPGRRVLPGAPAAADAAPAGAPLALNLSGPAQAKLGDRLSVSVAAQGGTAVSLVSFTLQFDPAVLKPLVISEGDLLRASGVQGGFEGQINESGGSVTGVLSTASGTVAAQGGVATVQFEVIGGSGETAVNLSSVTATGAGGASVNATPGDGLSLTLPAQP